MKPCQLCGIDMEVWGRMHICRPRPAVQPATHKPHVDNEAGKDSTVGNANLKTTVINIAPVSGARTNAQRQAKWRMANRDKHRERNRDLMRQRRATGRAA